MIGNPLNDGTWTYTWQAGRQLKSMSKIEGGDIITMEFTYNHDGLRTKKVKKVNGTVTETTEYILNGKNVVELIHTNHATSVTNRLHFFYDTQDKQAMVEFNGVKYSYDYNLQGDVVGIIDSTGNVVVEYKYNAWGRDLGKWTLTTEYSNLASMNPLRYRGYIYDDETWMYYCRARYYFPELQKWINADDGFDEGAGFSGCNLFTYCANKSVGLFDPDGDFLISMLLICVTAGAIIGGTIGGISGNLYADSKGYTGWNKAKCIITGTVAGAIIGGVGGYAIAPSVVAITGVASVSITTAAGITLIPAHLAGQYHHVLSNPIMRVLENHPLRDLFQRSTSVIQAMTEGAHKGYQQWHRLIDNHMVSWLQNHPNATENDFWKEIYIQYNTRDMVKRFGEAVLQYIKRQMK